MVPAVGRRNPLTVLSVVDLPEPFPPRSATIARSGTVSVTPRRTSVGPYQTRSPSMTSTGVLLAEMPARRGPRLSSLATGARVPRVFPHGPRARRSWHSAALRFVEGVRGVGLGAPQPGRASPVITQAAKPAQ